jgi:hypothetical protein
MSDNYKQAGIERGEVGHGYHFREDEEEKFVEYPSLDYLLAQISQLTSFSIATHSSVPGPP